MIARQNVPVAVHADANNSAKVTLWLIGALCFLGINRAPQAFTYAEHYKITLNSFEVACVKYEIEFDTIPPICNSQKIKQCYSHMVAVAADHTKSADDFIGTSLKHNLLKRPGLLDCQNLQEPTATKEDSETPICGNVSKMGRTRPWGWWSYIRLLPNNKSHFRPTSRDRWNDELDRALTLDHKTFFERLSYHAFSSHFLQDSFAAGHNGIDRTKYQQDYDQAYHDDFNGTGLFLKNEKGNIWYAYGDKHLQVETNYLAKDYCGNGARLADLPGDLNNMLNSTFETFQVNSLKSLCVGDGRPVVLSLADGTPNLLDPCTYWDNCDKTEIVYVPSLKSDELSQVCQPANESALVRCGWTKDVVGAAMNRQILALFYRLYSPVGAENHLAGAKDEIEKYIPTEYRAVEYQTGGRSYLNSYSFLLTYSEWKPLDDSSKYEPLSFRNWQIRLYNAESDTGTLEDFTVSAGLMIKIKDSNGEPEMYQTRLLNELAKALNENGRVELRFDLVSDDGNFLDGAELSYGYEFKRRFDRVVGVAAKGAIGVDDIWGGKVDRNWYYGGGLELNFHFGKNIYYLDMQSLRHRNSRIGDEESLRASIGWRVSSVVLGR